MRTNIEIDETKLEAIQAIHPFKSKRELIDVALHEYLRYLRRLELLKWAGNLEEWRSI